MEKIRAHRLLVCTIPERLQVAIDTLADYYTCDFCLNAVDAYACLGKKPDLVICNLHFDEGRLFDFLWLMRSYPSAQDTPLIIFHSKDSITPAMMKSIEVASQTIGINGFFESFQWAAEHPADEAGRMVREAIDAVLAQHGAAEG